MHKKLFVFGSGSGKKNNSNKTSTYKYNVHILILGRIPRRRVKRLKREMNDFDSNPRADELTLIIIVV